MDLTYNYCCRHIACQGYQECQFEEQRKRRDDFWGRLYRGEDSIRELGTDPLAALEGDLAEW